MLKRLLIVFVAALTLISALANTTVRAQTSGQTAKQPDIVIWTKFNDTNPQNTQDKWLADALKEYTSKTGNKITNVNQPYDQINAKLNVAVQSKGDVPDASYVDSSKLGFYTQNGTLIDLTDWAKSTSWYKDLSPAALASCTTPDGKILCIPTGIQNTLVYYWKDAYPNGFPATTDALLAAAKDIAAKGKFAITLKASESFSVEVSYFSLIKTFGGEIADKDGKAAWSNPGAVAAVQFLRTLFTSKYAPEVDLAPGFDDEEAFKRSDAGAFMAGSWSYVYLAPLTAPDGTKFDKDAGSVEAAFDAGKLGFAPPLSAPNSKPVSFAQMTGWAIPQGAVNVDAAKAFIDFEMTTERNVTYAIAYGALPTMESALKADAFQTPYWQAVIKYQSDFAQPAAGLIEYDKGITALSDTINKLLTDPSKDIAQALKSSQDEYNASVAQ